jgi:hypothetical protein
MEARETMTLGDRAVVLWVYRKTRNGQLWRLRGVDVFRARDGEGGSEVRLREGLDQRESSVTLQCSLPNRGISETNTEDPDSCHQF